MNTKRTRRSPKAPMYFLHRPAAAWESALARTVRQPSPAGATARERIRVAGDS